VLLFVGLAVLATLTNAAGSYVGDNRLEQFFNPARRVARSLSVWDGSRGLGRVREDFWPAGTLPLAMFRSLGANPIIAQKLWHALLLAMGGIGMTELLRLTRPKRSLEHLIAGLTFAFGAYSATFLTPFSNLYVQVALAPWLIVAFWRGLTGERPWRWAGVFALLVLTPGNVDTPGLVYALVPLIPVSLYLLFVDRSVTLRRYLGWNLGAGLLTLLVSAMVLAKVYVGLGAYTQRLNDTERAEISFRVSSWPEAARGLGNWLSYFRDSGQLLKPQFVSYFDNTGVILCTFVPVVVAVLTVWLSRWRPRLLYAGCALFSLAILVGGYVAESGPLAGESRSPLGRLLLDALNAPGLGAFRNTYKAGSGLAIGVAALFGYGVAASARRIARIDVQLASGPVVVAFAAMFVTAFPFWSGNLYNDTQQFRDVPAYWTDAFSWLDAQPGDDRVLLLPMSSRTRYRWGWVGDDIFDSLLARPHTVATGVPLSTPQAANLVETISFDAADPAYRVGTMAPTLRRLGIRYVLVRNDLDWRAMKRPRPSAYAGLRSDDGLTRVSTFGRPGENTVADGDDSPEADGERTLPPVEIYELRQPGSDLARLVTQQPPLLVAGDGAAWGGLALGGHLDGDVPVTYTGATTPDDLRNSMAAGSPIFITDTNRRRLRVVLSYEPDYSYLLADKQPLDGRLVSPLFKALGSESVAWFRDAEQIELTGPARTTDGSQPWYRPANVFDGNPTTTWSIRKSELPEQRSFRVILNDPQKVSSVTIDVPDTSAAGTGAGGIEELRLSFSDKSRVPISLRNAPLVPGTNLRRVKVDFTERLTSLIVIEIAKVDPSASAVALADVTFPGIELREYVQAPSDVQLLATQRSDVGELANRAPFNFLFLREPGGGPVDEETSLRRRFLVLNERLFIGDGDLVVARSTSDVGINRLVEQPISAAGSRRLQDEPGNWGGYAVDGDPSTAWVAPAKAGETLTLTKGVGGPATFDSISLSSARKSGYAVPKRVTILADGQEIPLDLTAYTPCPAGGSVDGCRAGQVMLPSITADSVQVRIDEVEGQSTRVKIDEIRVNGRPNPLIDLDRERSDCQSLGATVGIDVRTAQPVRGRLAGSFRQLLAGETVPFSTCDPVRLGTGWQLLDGGDNGVIDRLELRSADASTPKPRPPTGLEWTTTQISPTQYRIEGEAPNGAIAILQQSYASGWVADLNGRRLGPATVTDTMNGWVVNDRGHVVIDIRFTGQRWFNLASVVSMLAIVLSVILVAYPGGRRRGAAAPGAEGKPDG